VILDILTNSALYYYILDITMSILFLNIEGGLLIIDSGNTYHDVIYALPVFLGVLGQTRALAVCADRRQCMERRMVVRTWRGRRKEHFNAKPDHDPGSREQYSKF
jgi:hypothetical protein